MSEKRAELCTHRCPQEYSLHTPENVASVTAELESKGYDVIKSVGCLGVCTANGNNYPKQGIVNVRLTNADLDLNYAPRTAGLKDDGSIGMTSPQKIPRI